MVVLIVDDDQVTVDTLCLLLTHCGYQTYGAYSGPEALYAAGEHWPDTWPASRGTNLAVMGAVIQEGGRLHHQPKSSSFRPSKARWRRLPSAISSAA